MLINVNIVNIMINCKIWIDCPRKTLVKEPSLVSGKHVVQELTMNILNQAIPNTMQIPVALINVTRN